MYETTVMLRTTLIKYLLTLVCLTISKSKGSIAASLQCDGFSCGWGMLESSGVDNIDILGSMVEDGGMQSQYDLS